jgi:hypothetical protein
MYVVLLLEEEYYIQGPRWAPAGGMGAAPPTGSVMFVIFIEEDY